MVAPDGPAARGQYRLLVWVAGLDRTGVEDHQARRLAVAADPHDAISPSAPPACGGPAPSPRCWLLRVGGRPAVAKAVPAPPSPRAVPAAAPAALAARHPSWPGPAARAGGLEGSRQGWPAAGAGASGPALARPAPGGQRGACRQQPQAWAPAGAGWQGVGGRGRVGLREKWLYFSYTLHDGARYHTSASTQAFLTAHSERITEHPLPSYSPDYNPIEFLWRKKQKTGNLQQVLQGICRRGRLGRQGSGIFCCASGNSARAFGALL